MRRILNNVNTNRGIVSSEAKTMCCSGLKCLGGVFCPKGLSNYAKELYGFSCCTEPVASVYGVSTS